MLRQLTSASRLIKVFWACAHVVLSEAGYDQLPGSARALRLFVFSDGTRLALIAVVAPHCLAVQVDFVESGPDKCSRVGKYSFYFPAKLVKMHDHIEDVIEE